jgi:hypothetical protein
MSTREQGPDCKRYRQCFSSKERKKERKKLKEERVRKNYLVIFLYA